MCGSEWPGAGSRRKGLPRSPGERDWRRRFASGPTVAGDHWTVIFYKHNVDLAQIVVERAAENAGEVEHLIAVFGHVADHIRHARAIGHELEKACLDDEDLGGFEEFLAAVQNF